jgi:type I restriction enzyme S subunit
VSTWQALPLSDVLADARPGFACGQDIRDGVFQFRMNNVTTDGRLDLSKKRRVPKDTRNLEAFLLNPGDVLFNATNSPDLVGKSAFFPGYKEPAVFSNHFLRLRPQAEKLDGRFLSHWLTWQFQRRVFQSMCRQWVNQATVGRESLLALRLPVPSLAEQRRTAEILDRTEALRARRRAALAQLDTLTRSIFLDLLHQAGTSVATVSIEDGMEAIIDYRGKSPNKTAVGVPLVTARVVKGGELLEPNEFIAEEDYDAWMRRGFPNPGDVLFTTEAPLGEVAQLDGRKVALAQRLLVLRGKPSLLDNTFLKHALTAQEVKKQIDARATGSTVRGIRQRELRKVMIPVPPIALQRDFASRVTGVEKLKAAHRTSLAELNALFAMLQHRAFRGAL